MSPADMARPALALIGVGFLILWLLAPRPRKPWLVYRYDRLTHSHIPEGEYWTERAAQAHADAANIEQAVTATTFPPLRFEWLAAHR
jgi:hypothetical protein